MTSAAVLELIDAAPAFAEPRALTDDELRRGGLFALDQVIARLKAAAGEARSTVLHARMQLAAQREAERIEISQDARVFGKMIDAPMPEQVLLRDDFAGIVRLIDVIQSKAALLDRVVHQLKVQAGLAPEQAVSAASPAQSPDTGGVANGDDEYADEEVEASE